MTGAWEGRRPLKWLHWFPRGDFFAACGIAAKESVTAKDAVSMRFCPDCQERLKLQKGGGA